MDEPLASRPGSPRHHWDAAEHAPALPPETAPAVADLDDFTAHVDLRGPRWQGPALLLGLAVFCAIYAAVPGTGNLFDLSAEARRTALLVLAGVLTAAAAATLVWDLRTRANAYQRAYERFAKHGITARAFLTSLDVGHEQFQPAWVLIDADLSEAQAARLHAAFDSWINAALADPETRDRVVRLHRTTIGVLPSEELFGPEAAGGFLAPPLSRSRWHVMIPSGPPGPKTRWKVFAIHDGDTTGEPVPMLGSGE
ncbi:hypothetical protein AB0B28_14770 [Glycomyces sp. NPDC046736]|uniref:hypothetical protein n=1 Tax=Glycomyces sp. NPDC046736 TaxID=3155615 RepID=UPI0033C88CB8